MTCVIYLDQNINFNHIISQGDVDYMVTTSFSVGCKYYVIIVKFHIKSKLYNFR